MAVVQQARVVPCIDDLQIEIISRATDLGVYIQETTSLTSVRQTTINAYNSLLVSI